MSVASPVNELLVGNDVVSNSLTFTPYLELGCEHPILNSLL